MAWQVQIHRAKPNPAGKDKVYGQPIAKQLLGEWVDLKNVGDAAVSFSTLHLANAEFGPGCQLKRQAQIYWDGPATGILQPGEIVRVHTGRESDAWQMHPDDRSGVHHHAYANSGNFVLNNDCGDHLSVWWKTSGGEWKPEDSTSYDANPPEGQVLQRSGSKLVPVQSWAAR
ncbi:MAG TPA: hypothetical protein PKY38_02480 [Opitutaceae bacterium]|nr:hypothetical protein [Opitutaceae bacterium]